MSVPLARAEFVGGVVTCIGLALSAVLVFASVIGAKQLGGDLADIFAGRERFSTGKRVGEDAAFPVAFASAGRQLYQQLFTASRGASVLERRLSEVSTSPDGGCKARRAVGVTINHAWSSDRCSTRTTLHTRAQVERCGSVKNQRNA